MSRRTIDFGIDLGTTNSAISVLRGTIRDIIKNNVDADITPSAVYIDKRDQLYVGMRAKERRLSSPGDAHIEFKRRMGTDHRYQFKSSGRSFLPEELSAEVLKSLRADVQQRLGEEIHAVVITVPAAFEAKQCAATKKAAELAGFYQSSLLQEPVAAALAYGFQVETEKAYWLVYDFGGGTFDAAIIKAEDGAIHVVNHGGDNYLGGSDIDWAVVEQIIVPALLKEHPLEDFHKKNIQWEHAFALIKYATEKAKIELSRSETAYLEDCRFRTPDGEEIEVEFQLRREDLIRVAKPIIDRSIEISRRVLKDKGMSPSAIEKVILVGGPTLAPYFREILAEGLGIALDYSVDPLTVVARGAAVFAGTQRIDGALMAKAVSGEFDVELNFKSVGAEPDPTVWGEVSGPDGISLKGYTLEVVDTRTQWRSGKITLREDGRFKLNLLAEKGYQNIYSLELFDPTGVRQTTVPDTLAYTIGLAISEQPITLSLGLALANNGYLRFFNKGDSLPAKATHVVKSAHPLKQGHSGVALRLPIVEGENNLADRNSLQGSLDVHGAELKRDLPSGSEIEVTIAFDSSRIIKVKAYVPMLDEEFETVIDYKLRVPDADHIQKEHQGQIKRIKDLQAKAKEAQDGEAEAGVDIIKKSPLVQELAAISKEGGGDPDDLGKAEKRLLELKVELDRVEDGLRWPALVVEAKKALEDLDRLLKEAGTPAQKSQAAKLRPEIDAIISAKETDRLKKQIQEARNIYWDVLYSLPAFWVDMFNYYVKAKDKFTDAARGERLISSGQGFIQSGDVAGLKGIVNQLRDLVPRQVAEAAEEHGYKSGVLL